MKHTLNVLTLTALAAAASAQTAPASGLNYNQIGFSRTSTQNAVTAQGLLGGSNLLVGLQSTSNNDSEPSISIGYVFRGVTQGIDATIFVQQAQWENTAYGITLRRALNEVYAGLEISASYAGTLASNGDSYIALGGSSFWATSVNNVELSYNVNKTFAVAVGLTKGNYDNRQTVFSVRAGF